MSLYCPFWMLNKTGVMLTYRVSWCTYVLFNFSHDCFSDFQVIIMCQLQQLTCICDLTGFSVYFPLQFNYKVHDLISFVFSLSY
jgi:hypothetical protein